MKKLVLLILIISIYSKAQTPCNGYFFMEGSSVFSTGGSIDTYIQSDLSYNAD